MNLIPNFVWALTSVCSVFRDRIRSISQYHRSTLSAIAVLLFLFGSIGVNAQGIPNEAIWNGEGYSLKKVVSNTSIQSGVYFSYTILFTAPAGATTVTIQDDVPGVLGSISVPAPSDVNGVTPAVSISGSLVTYTLTGLPAGMASSGSFTIVVKFPEGTTCNGTSARNKADILVNDKWYSTPYVSTTAIATDPWKVSKSILSGAVVNPMGGACGYLMNEGDTIKYRLSVLKNSPYWGNFVGQENMTSAVVTDVLPAGAVFIGGTTPYPPVTESGGIITWNIGTLNAATPYAYYYCDVEIYYPVGSFPSGTFIYNELDLDGIICNQPVNHQSNETCIEVGEVIANPSGYFKKYISLTNRVPGCEGYYAVAFCNNGNVDLSAFNIDDVIPSGITVDQVAVYGANATTTINLTANSGANTIATGLTSYYSSGSLAFTVNDLQLAMTGVLPVGSCIYLYIYFTVDPNPAGTLVTNCATFDGLSTGLSIPDPTCVSFTVADAIPDPCLIKDVCSPQASYEPGDIVRFRLRVQNIGSDDISGASIQDILHSNFTYIGNESYYVSTSYNPPCSVGGTLPSGATAWTGVSASHSLPNLSWNLPDIPSDCQSFYTAYCGYYGTWGLPYYYIEFDVEVSNTALPGVTPNEYSITGGNLPSTETSNVVNVLVVASFGQEVEKQVSTDGGVTFASSGTTSAGATARYRLSYKNISNVPVSSINLVDLLPLDADPLDLLVLNRSISRGSMFEATYLGGHTTSVIPAGLATATLNFSPGENICLPPFGITTGGCIAASWAATPTDQNIRAAYGSFSLLPTYSLREDFNVYISDSAAIGQTVCNDFAALSTANFLLDGVPQSVALTPIAAPPVCLTVAETHASCCDSVSLQQVPGANCCVELKTTCKVKLIELNLTSGTISSASANCGTITPGFIGGTSLTFAGGCIPTLTTCFTPNSSGVVTGLYTIYFENGESCEKPLEMDCEVQSINCCDSIRIEQVMSPTGEAECCVKLSSVCEIKSVEVIINNSTIASANWNCGTIPAGYVGQSSYVFNPDSIACSTELTLCLNADVTGIVSVSYVITFTNGEVCQKGFEMDCKAVEINCCDSILVKQVDNADGNGCCVNISSLCDIRSVEINVANGTISSASWNCGTMATGYLGQSTFNFVVTDTVPCALDLTTCIEPTTTGTVMVSYVIITEDGEFCSKSIKLDCEAPPINCCDSVQITQVVDTTNQETCCVNLASLCEVRSVEVNVFNGTLASASWNCGTLPTGFEGLSSFTFDVTDTIPCALDLTLCFDAITSGVVSASYVITFANGEVCQKGIEIDCKVPDINCCDSIQIGQVIDATGAETCCVNLNALCEVQSVEVLIDNGTIASASWNCGTIPSGYVGQSSYTFNTDPDLLCALDMTLCVDPLITGVVTITFIITTVDGEVCQKSFEMDCETTATNCCDSIWIKQVSDATGAETCCVNLLSACEVRSVEVYVFNGTIASANWNCGTLPTGYTGLSSYTFDVTDSIPCALDLTLCFDATTSGVVSVSYVITFANGETCQKGFELDCKATVGDCCDSINVYKALDEGCCAKLTSECKVEEVKVEIQNGTIASAVWNCGTLPAGYVGQSNFGFTTGGCADLSMLLCVDAIVSGTVVIDYVIILADGSQCEKRIELECEAPVGDCCDSINIYPAQDEGCCAKLVSDCKVDKVKVEIQNGTIASAAWNCGTLPTGYVGASNFVFDAGGCDLSLLLCVDAIVSGVVVIDYNIILADGTQCEKRIELECKAPVGDCCDSIKIYPVQDKGCCAKITSECEVELVKVDIQNGTIASAAWNCGTLPTGYTGASSFGFNTGGCTDFSMLLCVDAIVPGIVVINYIIVLADGTECEKRIELDCESPVGDCCDSIMVNPVQDEGCCAKLSSECAVEKVKVEIQNGTIASAAWNCGTLPTGYVGATNFVFDAAGCDISLLLCVDAFQTGIVVINYTIILSNGEVCEKSIELECEGPVDSDCCPIVDFKLKSKWPWFNTQVGTFEIMNPDPTTPICSVEITAAPAGTFTTGNLWIDNSLSSQSWTASNIPTTGSLSPAAVNNIKFNLIATGYKGSIEICVIKCDGTRCCYKYKWNNKPWIDVSGTIDHVSITHSLFALTAKPVIDSDVNANVKYISFGIDEKAIEKQSNVEFFAISGASHDDDNTTGVEIKGAYMSAYNAFYELQTPKPAKGNLGLYNLVFSNSLPDVNMTLFDNEGNIVFTGISSFTNGQVVTSFVEFDLYSGGSGDMFEFINLYPNPNNGQFKITYAIGQEKDIHLQVVNAAGQVLNEVNHAAQTPGVHETTLDAGTLPAGNYKMVLRANGVIQSKSFVVK